MKTWTPQMDALLRAEVLRLFEERTPPKRVDEMLPENRVNRSEIRSIAQRMFGILPPEMDADWVLSFAEWYVTMARGVMKAKGEKNPHARRLGKYK